MPTLIERPSACGARERGHGPPKASPRCAGYVALNAVKFCLGRRGRASCEAEERVCASLEASLELPPRARSVRELLSHPIPKPSREHDVCRGVSRPPISSDAKPMWGGNRVFPGNFKGSQGRFGMFHDRENPSNLRMCMERVHLGAYSMYAWWKIARDSHWEFGAECVDPGR